MSRVYNFSAGPAVLPEEVLKEAADEMLDYKGSGMSVMEMSHRSKVFQNIIDEAEADLRDIAFYIAKQSKDKNIAIRFVNKLREKCKNLEILPESGSLPKERVLVSNGYRFLIHDNYLMFYYYVKEENTVYVNAVFNAKQDYTRVMKKFI